MINFVIYENEKKMVALYKDVINRFLYSRDDFYKIHEFEKYNPSMQERLNSLDGTKVYLISLDINNLNGLEVARSIRTSGDFTSPIILFTAQDKRIFMDNLQNVLFLNLIEKNDQLIKNLIHSLKDAYKMITRYSVYTFSIFDEVYRIRYDDIYYVKKNINDDSVTIYTKDDSYLDYMTIKGMQKMLASDPRFFKVHRSCIVNLYNVSSYDRKSNILTFCNGLEIDLVSRHNKTLLSEKLKDFCN